MKDSILVIGALGQIGSELVSELRTQFPASTVIAGDIKEATPELLQQGPYVKLDVMDLKAVHEIISKHNVKRVYLLAALLSATAEQKIKLAWKLNMDSLIGLLDMAEQERFKLFWPSSIAVFGHTTPRINTPQLTITEPSTVYGISKLAGERWCEYYHNRYNVDVRSIRYPGLIGYKSEPGGGTTDYAVHIFHEAVKSHRYECFLEENTALPMMYMPDALRATINLMEADSSRLSIRGSYNIAGMTFTPKDIANEIRKHIPDFTINYKPDIRQQYAASWPESIDDSVAAKDWNWKAKYDLPKMTTDMLANMSIHA